MCLSSKSRCVYDETTELKEMVSEEPIGDKKFLFKTSERVSERISDKEKRQITNLALPASDPKPPYCRTVNEGVWVRPQTSVYSCNSSGTKQKQKFHYKNTKLASNGFSCYLKLFFLYRLSFPFHFLREKRSRGHLRIFSRKLSTYFFFLFFFSFRSLLVSKPCK